MQIHRLLRPIAALILLISTLHSTAWAQQRFSAGPRLGVNLSTYAGGNGQRSAIAGVTAGAFVMYSSLNHFGISADLLYSQKGASIMAPDAYRQRINYLEIPIALRYFLTRSGTFRPNLYAGPNIAFKLNATETRASTNAKRDMTSEINAVDLGVMAGFQLNFAGLGARQRFLIDGRYTYGLPEVFIRPDVDRHNSVFTLTLGYGFGIGPEFKSARRR